MSNIRIRVAACIFNQKGELLLFKHRRGHHEYWVLPGGGLEFGETIEQGLKRELKEELNVEISVGNFIEMHEAIIPDQNRHILNLFYKAEIISGIPKLAQEERLADFAYFSLNALASLVILPPVDYTRFFG